VLGKRKPVTENIVAKIVKTRLNYGRLASRLGSSKPGYLPGTLVLIRHFMADELACTISRYFKVDGIVGLVRCLPKLTSPINGIGRARIHINPEIDYSGRFFPVLRNYAHVLGVEGHKLFHDAGRDVPFHRETLLNGIDILDKSCGGSESGRSKWNRHQVG
jgi:hypothetical protein